MTIRRLPSQPAKQEVDLAARTEAFINRGLQVSSEPETPVDREFKPKNVLLTLPGGSNTRIEKLLKARRVRIPRHTWILEAIVEKLDREEGN